MKHLQDLIKDKVSDYKFSEFSKPNSQAGEILDFKFKEFSEGDLIDTEQKQVEIKIERNLAFEKSFEISPIVKKHRGIKQQELDETERKIQIEVQKRVETIQKEAFERGYQEGVESGREEVFKELRQATEEKMSHLSELVNEVLALKSDLIKTEKEGIYTLVRNLVKWITLKEIKDDKNYIIRLLDRLIEEMDENKNMLIRLDESSFQDFPDLLDHVKEVLGKLENIRLEIDYEIEGPGIILETESGIINGTLKEQLKALDKLFSVMGLESPETTPFGSIFGEAQGLTGSGSDEKS